MSQAVKAALGALRGFSDYAWSVRWKYTCLNPFPAEVFLQCRRRDTQDAERSSIVPRGQKLLPLLRHWCLCQIKILHPNSPTTSTKAGFWAFTYCVCIGVGYSKFMDWMYKVMAPLPLLKCPQNLCQCPDGTLANPLLTPTLMMGRGQGTLSSASSRWD